MLLVVFGLVVLAFTIYLGMLFFQFNSIERKLEETVETIEVYLLQEFGELSQGGAVASDEVDAS